MDTHSLEFGIGGGEREVHIEMRINIKNVSEEGWEGHEEVWQDGDVEIHNIAIERCFRHIAMGRRNWGKG